ncbi:hypothetical protein RvY_08723 [Ramazzottius varieornatus]|uniref:Uncharacterized protein n=1 Tax=Ramazzottius varieornatus TaxID=947166 RepID=A0A1D1V6V1_RAMVA|nr:hypothetical protein RvY_08723 [Ramazzottius varieornatus]
MVRNAHKFVTNLYGVPPSSPPRKSFPPDPPKEPHRYSVPRQVMDVHAFFRPLVSTLQWSGLFFALNLKDEDDKEDELARRVCRKIGRGVLHCARSGYLFVMWCWTVLMSINIVYMVISGAPESLTVKNGKEGHHGNLVIVLLDEYACLWLIFTTVPFLLSQLALCFPVLFAYVLRRYFRLVNKELALLATVDTSDTSSHLTPREWAARLRHLRGAHFDICHLLHQTDKAVNQMLLVQFICDIFILFGFVGNLVNSRDARPPKATLEWTFYIPASITWLFFFLLHFSFPLIHMSQEAERTHAIVHTLSFTSPPNLEVRNKVLSISKTMNLILNAPLLLQQSFNDLQIFLAETKDGSHLAFTGGNFYCVNRHYVVTCVALLVSYLTVLTEILDRYYGNEDIREAIARLAINSAINDSNHATKLDSLLDQLSPGTRNGCPELGERTAAHQAAHHRARSTILHTITGYFT